VKICNSPIEPTKIAVVPTHVSEPVEEVDQTRSRNDDGEPLLGRGGREMRSRTPDSSVGLVGLAKPGFEEGHFSLFIVG
jgi:hypothetical protein